MPRKRVADHCVGSNDGFRLAVGLWFFFAFQARLSMFRLSSCNVLTECWAQDCFSATFLFHQLSRNLMAVLTLLWRLLSLPGYDAYRELGSSQDESLETKTNPAQTLAAVLRPRIWLIGSIADQSCVGAWLTVLYWNYAFSRTAFRAQKTCSPIGTSNCPSDVGRVVVVHVGLGLSCSPP